MTTTTQQEIAALNARIQELQGVGSSWMADWGRVDDEIIRERKAIHDSARDQILQLQQRITELEKLTPAAAAGRLIAWAALVVFTATPIYVAGQSFRERWLSPLAVAGGAIALVAGAARITKNTRFTKEAQQ